VGSIDPPGPTGAFFHVPRVKWLATDSSTVAWECRPQMGYCVVHVYCEPQNSSIAMVSQLVS